MVFNHSSLIPSDAKWIVNLVKGCGMGTQFVLVSPCVRENVVVTCKIGSLLCSLDLLQKNVIVFLFGNQISKWRSFEKRAIFDLVFTFFNHQRKITKNSFSTYLTHMCILLMLLTFFVLPILKKIWIYQVWFLFGMNPGPYFIKVKIFLKSGFEMNWSSYVLTSSLNFEFLLTLMRILFTIS